MLPTPERGTIISYAYNWFKDYESGIETPDRPHPSLVLALSIIDGTENTKILALAITHSPPYVSDDALEIPDTVKAAAGLDAHQQWVVIGESNVFTWPGPDLRQVPRKDPPTHVYGKIPSSFLLKVAQAFSTRNRRTATSAKEVTRR